MTSQFSDEAVQTTWIFRIAQSGGDSSQFGGSSETSRITGNDSAPYGGTRQISQFSEDVADQLKALKDIAGDVLLLVGLAAIAVLVISQVSKFPLRSIFHYAITWRWGRPRQKKVAEFLNARETPPGWLNSFMPKEPAAAANQVPAGAPAPASAAPAPANPPHLSPWQLVKHGVLPIFPKDLYIKKLQNLAQRTLERPTEDPALFAYLAADAATNDLVVVYSVDKIAKTNPEFLSRIAEPAQAAIAAPPPGGPSKPEAGVAAAVASAQDNVASAVERGLDDIQIRILFWWPIYMTTVALAIGVALALIFGARIGHPGWLILIGIAAGYLATIAYDVLSWIAAFKPNRQ